jgi:hypothetical protein
MAHLTRRWTAAGCRLDRTTVADLVCHADVGRFTVNAVGGRAGRDQNGGGVAGATGVID